MTTAAEIVVQPVVNGAAGDPRYHALQAFRFDEAGATLSAFSKGLVQSL
jgi:hypothetical protein